MSDISPREQEAIDRMCDILRKEQRITPAERRLHKIHERIRDLQSEPRLTSGEQIELEFLLREQWSL